jgi:hypothetical protein
MPSRFGRDDKALYDLMTDVWETGAARVEERLLYRMLGTSRMRDSHWGALLETFEKVREDAADKAEDKAGWRLGYVTWGPDGHWTFLCLDPEGTSPDNSGFQPVNTLKTGETERKATKGRKRPAA